MNSAGMMAVGVLAAVTGMAGELAGHNMLMVVFAGGALFGKGYGVWEAKNV